MRQLCQSGEKTRQVTPFSNNNGQSMDFIMEHSNDRRNNAAVCFSALELLDQTES